VPHYWFRIPLSSTAPHLKAAKEKHGANGVQRELEKDVAEKQKSLSKPAVFDPDMNACEAWVFSVRPMTREECQWFRDRWDIKEPSHAPCRPMLAPHEVELGPPDDLQGWGPPNDEEPESTP